WNQTAPMKRSKLYFTTKRHKPQKRYAPLSIEPSHRQRSESFNFINYFLMPNIFWILLPSFTNFVNAFVGQRWICSYHSFVVSKNPARSRRRCSVYLSVSEPSSVLAIHSRNMASVGST